MRTFQPFRCWAGATGHSLDITNVTTRPTTQPRSTSPTRFTPCSRPWTLVCDNPPATTMHAVIGALRHDPR